MRAGGGQGISDTGVGATFEGKERSGRACARDIRKARRNRSVDEKSAYIYSYLIRGVIKKLIGSAFMIFVSMK